MASQQDACAEAETANKYNDTVCVLCGGGENEQVLMLCDGCDKGFHTYCINLPALPIEDWFCPACRRTAEASLGDDDATEPGHVYPGLDVIFYERVSSKGQNEPEYGRVGMDTQNHTLLEFALENGLIIHGTFREVYSARDPSKLTELNRLCKMLKNKCLVVYSVSRFSRNLEQGHKLITAIHAAGGWVWSVAEKVSSFDPQFLQLLSEAQAESDRLSLKMREAYARIRRHGGHIGPAPFGQSVYRDEAGIRRLMPNPNEQEILAKLQRTYQDTQDASQTAFMLNNSGCTRRGKAWTVYQVRKYLGGLNNNTVSRDLRAALPSLP